MKHTHTTMQFSDQSWSRTLYSIETEREICTREKRRIVRDMCMYCRQNFFHGARAYFYFNPLRRTYDRISGGVGERGACAIYGMSYHRKYIYNIMYHWFKLEILIEFFVVCSTLQLNMFSRMKSCPSIGTWYVLIVIDLENCDLIECLYALMHCAARIVNTNTDWCLNHRHLTKTTFHV